VCGPSSGVVGSRSASGAARPGTDVGRGVKRQGDCRDSGLGRRAKVTSVGFRPKLTSEATTQVSRKWLPAEESLDLEKYVLLIGSPKRQILQTDARGQFLFFLLLTAAPHLAHGESDPCNTAYWNGSRRAEADACEVRAKAGGPNAEFGYALLLWSGHDRPSDHTSALEWFRMSARHWLGSTKRGTRNNDHHLTVLNCPDGIEARHTVPQ
jgi:hypothetical protein